jgi:tRNA (mo5U34)-methyltransferase
VPQLLRWLDETGYDDIEVIDTSLTTTGEQRSTEWMKFESLQESLDPSNPALTVEGWPAPRRVIITATAPNTRHAQ